MSNQGVVPVVTNISMADPVQNQQTRFFSACSSVVGSLSDQSIQEGRFKISCSFLYSMSQNVVTDTYRSIFFNLY